MSWFFPWSDNIKKRSCRYLLQRYLGQFLEEKLTLDQLSVDLYNGTGSVLNVSLDVQALNELSEQHNWPIEFVDGFISEISVSIPWSSLLRESSIVQIDGLNLVIQPKERSDTGVSMFESVWSSMTSSSILIAEECLKQTSESEQPNPLEGLVVFAQTIDSILTRVKLKFVNTLIRLEYLPKDKLSGAALEFHIKHFSYFDEAGTETAPEGPTAYMSAFVTKHFILEGIRAYTNEFHVNSRTVSKHVLAESTVSQDGSSSNIETNETSNVRKSAGHPDAILFAKVTGRQEIRLQVKQAENISGPKINVEVNFNSLTIFISPRQLRTICDVVYGLISPHLQDNSNVINQPRFPQKPMNIFDFEKIEQELIQQVSPGGNISADNTKSLQNTTGWTSGGVADDSDEDFHPFRGSKTSDSLASSGSSSVSSYGSTNSSFQSCSKAETFTNRQRNSKPRSKRKGNIIEPDINGDLNVYSVRLNFLSVVLLHQDIIMSHTPTSLPDTESIQKMKTASLKFFTQLNSLLTSGYGYKDFENTKQIFIDAVCQRNHFRLMATTISLWSEEKNDTNDLEIQSTLSLANIEVIECLIPNECRSPVQYIELLRFTKNRTGDNNNRTPSCSSSAKPDTIVNFKYSTKLRRYTVPRQIDIKVNFQQCTIEFDISTFDRLKDILTNLQLFYSECLNSSSTRNDYDKDSNLQNMLEDRYIEIKYDWKCYFPSFLIKFRFPIPDVRPVYNVDESPWWVRNVYDDILFIELIEVSVINTATSHQIYWNYEVNCRSFRCSFQYSKSDSPIQFIASSGNAKDAVSFSNNGDDFLYSRLVLKLCPRISYIDLEDDVNIDEMKQSVMDHGVQEPSPFASKKVMRESGTQHSRSQNNEGEEIILLPGSKEEISDFIEDAKRNARIQIDISVPGVIIQIPSKHFFEVIYNRFSNDLLLWIPKIMKPTISNDNEINVPFIKSDSHSYKTFSACKSAMSYDSDSDEEYDTENDLSGQTKKVNSCKDYSSVHNKQSKLTICLFVAQGVLDIFPNARDTFGNVIPGQYGELQILFDEAHLFNVSSHKGKPHLNFVCLQVNHGSLYHSSLIPHGVGFEIKPFNSYPSKHLEPVIYKTGPGGIINESTPIVGTGSETSDDMVTLAIKVSILDKTIKNICVANSLCCGTLRYRSQNAYSNWLVQMINFFDITDYPIPHYQPMKVVTQLYQQFVNCIIDYRPLYLPYKAAISMENFNICSNITAKTSTSVLRFIAEEVSLFLSPNKTKQGNVQSQNDPLHILTDYVCVVDFGLFELSLRLTDNADSPRIDLRASNNAFHIRTCSDSAIALMELIKYIASDGDLRNNMTDSSSDLGAQTDSNLLICGSESQRSSSSVYSSESMNSSTGRVSDLMEEAINDTANEKSNKNKLHGIMETGEVFFFPDEENQIAGILCSNEEQLSNMLAQSESDDEFEDEYCMLDHATDSHITIHSNKAGAPEIRLLTNDTIRVVDNYFSLPVARADVLKAPKGYPAPVARYTLREMTIVWHMYGGYDFQQLTTSTRHFTNTEKDKNSSEPTVTFENNLSRYSSSDSVNTVNSTFTDSDSAIVNFIFRQRHRSESSNNSYSGSPVTDKLKVPIWKTQGGLKRDHDSLMELQLSKLKFQHEVYPEHTKQASRYVLLIQDVEIRDRLSSSNINKFLYQYYSTARPKQSNANMVVIKATNIRPELNISNLQECCLRVSLLPLRLNIDQDSLLFLVRFMTDLSDNNCHLEENTKYDNSCHAERSPLHQHPVMNIENTQSSPSIMVQVDDGSSQFSTVQTSWPIFIRSFVFSPDVPVRIDYEGKRVDMSHGPIAGLIMGLAQLSCSELKLKRICNRHGFLGIDKLISFVLTEWLQDIKKNQLPSILGGVGPIYSLVQLFQGIRDLFWLPIEQYQKDGRIVRGLQRGANSFTTSTAMAALELTSRIVYAIQRIAETAFDIVSPGPSIRSLRYDRVSVRKDKRVRRYKYGQPADIREGVTTALLLVKEGFGETAQTLVRVASKEHEVKGTVGAVGGVLRQIPSTALTPIILASQATSNVLGGVKSQLIPDARNEAALKWRNDYF